MSALASAARVHQVLTDPAVPFAVKETLLFLLHRDGAALEAEALEALVGEGRGHYWRQQTETMGVVGNVWVRVQHYPRADVIVKGHKHHHDHLSLLARGRLLVYVEGCQPVEYSAPAFFLVPAEHEHRLVPLEPETLAYCIFALRGEDGEVVGEWNGDETPYGAVDIE